MKYSFCAVCLAVSMILGQGVAGAETQAATPVQESPSAQADPQAPVQIKSDGGAVSIVNGRLISLEDAVSMALGGHPRIMQAEADSSNGVYKTMEARAAYWPQIFFNTSYGYSHTEGHVTTSGIKNFMDLSNSSADFNFKATWTVFDCGRTYYRVKSFSELEKSLISNIDAAKQSVAYDVIDSYFGLLRAQSLVKVSEETMRLAKAHLDQANAFFEVGTKPRFDVTSAEVEVNNAQLGLISATDAVRAARINLNTKIGIDPLAETAVEDMPMSEKLDKPINEFIKEALASRPELLAQESVIRSNAMIARAETAGYLPTFSTSAQYDWNSQDDSFDQGSSVQLAMSVPIFEGFRTKARVGQASAAILSSTFKLEDAKLSVMNEVSGQFIAVEDAAARSVSLESSVKKARENLEIAQGRYEAGVGAILDVTAAQLSLTTAETDKAQAYYDYHIAYSRLLRSVGKTPAPAR